ARADLALVQDPRSADLAEHGADSDRASQAVCYFGMSPYKRDIRLVTSFLHLAHDRREVPVSLVPGRQENRQEKPARLRAHNGYVVRVDRDEVPTEIATGQCNRVGFRNEELAFQAHDRSVLTDCWADDNAGASG